MAHGRVARFVRGRGFLIVPAAALVVHQLRFTLAYGSQAKQVLAAEGHSYLNSLAPWLVLLLALGLGSFVLRVARAARPGAERRPARRFLGVWALAWASLVAIYVAQEFLEGLFAVGHPSGAAGIFGHGGWWAVVVAGLAAAAVAGLLRVGETIVAAAGRLAVRRRFARTPPLARGLREVSLAPLPPLAGAAAGRAPPFA